MDPSLSFEDEILSLNPDYDLIFSKQEETRLNQSPQHLEGASGSRQKCSPKKMKIISKMNEIIGIKPVGELPAQNDWEDTGSCEKETIALMRTLGLEPSIDRAPDERRTIATIPLNDDVIFMRNGRKKMSIFMGNTYFELKPRSEPSFCTEEEETSTEASTTTDFSDDVNAYEPIPLDSTQVTTISEDDSVEERNQRVPPFRHFDSGVSSDSCKHRPVKDEAELSWRVRSPLPDVGRDSRKARRSHDSRSNESGSSSSSWWRSNDSSTEARDEKNWRVNVSKPPADATVEKKEEQVVTVKPETKPTAISNCGSPLFKPKQLFMKKRAMLIQQVLAENQL